MVRPWYFIDFGGVYHTEEHCPIGRAIPPDLRVEDVHTGCNWCPACQAREEARLRLRLLLAHLESGNTAAPLLMTLEAISSPQAP